MFPTAHDITNNPWVRDPCFAVIQSILNRGYDLLIVTKPELEVIQLFCEIFRDYRDMIELRFTITSADEELLKFWEPNAPNFTERLACLEYAYKTGFATSVSCEPYLDPYVVYTYSACKPYITDSFWVGKLRGFTNRVKLDDATPELSTKSNVESNSTMNTLIILPFSVSDNTYNTLWALCRLHPPSGDNYNLRSSSSAFLQRAI